MGVAQGQDMVRVALTRQVSLSIKGYAIQVLAVPLYRGVVCKTPHSCPSLPTVGASGGPRRTSVEVDQIGCGGTRASGQVGAELQGNVTP